MFIIFFYKDIVLLERKDTLNVRIFNVFLSF